MQFITLSLLVIAFTGLVAAEWHCPSDFVPRCCASDKIRYHGDDMIMTSSWDCGYPGRLDSERFVKDCEEAQTAGCCTDSGRILVCGLYTNTTRLNAENEDGNVKAMEETIERQSGRVSEAEKMKKVNEAERIRMVKSSKFRFYTAV